MYSHMTLCGTKCSVNRMNIKPWHLSYREMKVRTEFELQEVQLQPLPELQAVDDQFESEDPGAQSEDKERNKRYVDISLQDNANKNTIYKTKFDMKLFRRCGILCLCFLFYYRFDNE